MDFKNIDEFSILEAFKKRKKLKNWKASGPVKVSTTIIKDVAELISKALAMIFYSSFTNEIFPVT